jgi:hypothetical protein
MTLKTIPLFIIQLFMIYTFTLLKKNKIGFLYPVERIWLIDGQVID